MRKMPRRLVVSALLVWSCVSHAATYLLPSSPDHALVGELQYIEAKYEDTLLILGRRYSIGYEEMLAANPGVNPWLPGEGTRILIPSRYVLPDAPRVGIVVNLPEHRLYYFPPVKPGEQPTVQTYPVSTGKVDRKTPMGLTKIVDKRANPIWYPTESIRSEHAARGEPLPKWVPAGPDNPLGEFAMRLGFGDGTFLIHGTNKPAAVGMEVTHGCIRMFPEDIEQFFKVVPVQTPVRIVYQTAKMGWGEDGLYMQTYKVPDAIENSANEGLTSITRALVAATQSKSANINWEEAERVFNTGSGVPMKVASPVE